MRSLDMIVDEELQSITKIFTLHRCNMLVLSNKNKQNANWCKTKLSLLAN
jgi:hypothetical protein